MILAVTGLAAAYQGISALRRVDLEIDEGEFVTLIGPNGAGKSTLLNCLSGIVKPKSGSISFLSSDIVGVSAYKISRQGLLHVPEGRQILVELTIEENLQLGELARGSRPSQFDISYVYQLFPILEERRKHSAGALSGGQQQMLAIGRALMGNPKLLLLDEPSLGLSPLVTDQVFEVLQTLNERGLAILLVEQNARRALEASTRAYVIERGTIVYQGLSKDLAKDSRIVEHYLG